MRLSKYDVIMTAKRETTYLLGFFRRFFHIKSPRHIVLELMLDEEQGTRYWRAKRAFQEYVFSSVDIVFVSSTEEIAAYAERLNKPTEHFRFVPFNTNVMEPRVMGRGTYVLSAGRSGRDYRVFADAMKDLDVEAIVVSDRPSVEGIVFPANVTVLIDVALSRYYDLLYNSRLVAIPLKRLARSTGQVVMLDAMAAGKPIIATETVGTKDYIRPGVNGILVPPEDPISLRNAIRLLLDSRELEDRFSINNLESVKEHYTLDTYVRSILGAAESFRTTVQARQ
jgi:glycosyltransferase involved in cell wall biosynthesis